MNIDLTCESESHVRLRDQLHSYVFENKEADDLRCHHYQCSLGKWLYSEGLEKFKNIPEIHKLERIHSDLHHKIIRLLDIDKVHLKEQAASILKEIEVLSDDLSACILSVKNKLKIHQFYATSYTPIPDFDHGEQLNKAVLEMNWDLMKEHDTLFDFFMQAPGLFCVLKGPQHVFQLVNPYYKQVIGNRELKGKEIRKAMPELQGQGVFELLDKVFEKQRVFSGKEVPIVFEKGEGVFQKAYVNFIYKPIINRKNETTGILMFGYDVTEQVDLRKRSEENETRLKIAIDAAEMGSFEWDMNSGKFIYSERLLKIFGHPKNSVISHKIFVDSIHPDDKKIRVHAIEESMRSGNLLYEARIIKPNNTIRWVKFCGRIIFDKKRNPQKMYGTALDVTDQKTLNERLEKNVTVRTKELMLKNELLSKQKELSDRVINTSIDNIAVLDTKLRFVILNDNAVKAYKKRSDRIIGQQIHKIFPQILKTGMYRDLRKALKGEVIHNFNYRSPILKGYFEVTMLPLRDNKNKVYSVLMIAHDNTSIVEASERLITANKKLEDKNAALEKNNRELEAFRYIANHDLQEPLRKIQIFTGLINNNLHKTTQVKEYLENIKHSSRSMSDLIQAVLDFSKLSSPDRNFVKVDLNKILRGAQDKLQPLIDEKKAVIRNKELIQVYGIENQLEQLFCCLISNGLKFCNSSPVINITSKIIVQNDPSSSDGGNKYIELVFKDNGIGFEQKYAEQIFKMFKRLQTSKSFPGAGIGLAVVKRIVENHYGQIFVKSEPGKGTSFYIYLPCIT